MPILGRGEGKMRANPENEKRGKVSQPTAFISHEKTNTRGEVTNTPGCCQDSLSKNFYEDAYHSKDEIEANRYWRRISDRMTIALSEGGTRQVITNHTHHWLGFVTPLKEMPELVNGELWRLQWTNGNGKCVADRFDESTGIFGWFYLREYAQRSWRIRNDGLRGSVSGLPRSARFPENNPYNRSHGYEKIELSFHESEIEDINIPGLKRLILEVLFGCPVTWPIAPWSDGGVFQYHWTEKGLGYMNTRFRHEREDRRAA
jgi:hypothetical protein